MIVQEKDLKRGELPVNKIVLGDAYKVLKKLPDNCIDAVVTDPPYGLEFMNQDWDRDVPPVKLWKEVLRVLKPGGHLLSFFGTRTYHRGVVNIEDAGFEIRDMIVWLYGSGFNKGMDISKAIDKELGAYDKRKIIGKKERQSNNHPHFMSKFDESLKEWYITEPATPEAKQWQGWNTTLKPACEPIVLARKPISEKNVARNVLKWGVGGLNIDACRIPVDEKSMPKYRPPSDNHHGGIYQGGFGNSNGEYIPHPQGRYPANVILDEVSAKMLDEQTGITSKPCGSPNKGSVGKEIDNYIYGKGFIRSSNAPYVGDSGGASRFFYCTKAGRDERFAYCQDCDEVIPQKEWEKHKNHKLIFHTTVKPLKLMEYLVRLVTPPNGIVLDPFFGTGTTGIACLKQGFRFIGIEINVIYCKIAYHRLKPYLSQKTLLELIK